MPMATTASPMATAHAMAYHDEATEGKHSNTGNNGVKTIQHNENPLQDQRICPRVKRGKHNSHDKSTRERTSISRDGPAAEIRIQERLEDSWLKAKNGKES